MNYFSKFTFISYFEAKQYLEDRFDSTPDEIALWVSIGAEKGGLNAYTSECGKQSRFSFEPGISIDDDDYIKPLEKLYFLSRDIVQFQPDRRYITRLALKERWIKFYGIWEIHDYEDEDEAMNYLETKINGSHLREYHPITGVVETSGQLFRNGLFDKKEVEEKELEQTQKSTRAVRENKLLKRRTNENSKIMTSQAGTKKPGKLKLSDVSSVKLSQRVLIKKCIVPNRNSNSIITLEKAPTLQYGEPELLLGETITFLPALKLLGDGWTTAEFALNVFYGSIRAFEQSGSNELLRPIVNIKDWLIQYGKALTIDDKQFSIQKALLKFNYSKPELSQFKPKNRYVSFQDAKTRISDLFENINIDDAEEYLMNAIEQNKIFAFHFFVGAVTPELSMNGERWRDGYFAEWLLNQLLSAEFGEESLKIVDKTVGIDASACQTDNAQASLENIYSQRKISFNTWHERSKVNIKVLTTEKVFDQVKKTDKDLWNITLASFKRDFWQQYSTENNIKKKPGRPATK
jgi:hypothetical protein